MKYLSALIALLFLYSCNNNSLKNKVEQIVKDKKLTAGVSVIVGDEEFSYNAGEQFPLLSVFKFHQALTVLDALYTDGADAGIDTEIFVDSTDLHVNTHSPLRDERPEGNFLIPVGKLLHYSVSLSDNNACDILFKHFGGTTKVNSYIKSLGIDDINIEADEVEMHKTFENQYKNWSTPSATTKLLKKFVETPVLIPEYQQFLINTMLATTTGANKIKGMLPENVQVGHKTGSSSRNEEGLKIAENDAGFIYLSNNRICYITIFVKNSYETDEVNAQVIAEIAKAVYEHYK